MRVVSAAAVLLAGAAVRLSAQTTPPSRDTVGYWQQRADYTITAKLDEEAGRLVAEGVLRYVNRSPDSLFVLKFHQYLNAFRPFSAWSAADRREGRERFGALDSTQLGFERFLRMPAVRGVPLRLAYPLAPDSTVAVVTLPRGLAPGDSVDVTLAWTARPSTVARRQGRRGRHWDFAHWYPKVAVYDRRGWQDRPLVPAGEFYGEFGTFDVTLIVATDQVIGATGVPVEGDPGWGRNAGGTPAPRQARAYGPPPSDTGSLPPLEQGWRRVRWMARDVHHFAWSANPAFIHEGRAWVRRATPTRALPFVPFDTVAVHALFLPGDVATWGGDRAVDRTVRALEWLEDFYGPYPYPQVTNLHRLDGGGTEFPMLFMNGSASQGLILHEFGHLYSYGILANNEWREGWLDEGLTSFQTSWALGDMPAAGAPPGAAAQRFVHDQAMLDLRGVAQPLATEAAAYREFGVYNRMIYGRGERMWRALRDVLGDSLMRETWRRYYARWALRHVDEAAIRAEAERVSGRDLGWFFDQWIRRTGLVDYAIGHVSTVREGADWVVRAPVRRAGEYVHAPHVGVRTASGWTLAQAAPDPSGETWVTLRVPSEPLEVRLDPFGTSGDWNRRNDTPRRWYGHAPTAANARNVLDRPWRDPWSPGMRTTAWSVLPWYTVPGGASAALRWRMRTADSIDVMDIGMGYASSRPVAPVAGALGHGRAGRNERGAQFPFWWTWRNPSFGRRGRPVFGLAMGLWDVDGIARAAVSYRMDRSRHHFAETGRTALTLGADVVAPNGRWWLDERWSGTVTTEGRAGLELRAPTRRVGDLVLASGAIVEAAGGVVGQRAAGAPVAPRYARGELTVTARATSTDERWYSASRIWIGATTRGTPVERGVWLSSAGPIATMENPWWRGAGAPLGRVHGVPFVPLGGAGLRGASPFVPGAVVGARDAVAGLLAPVTLLAINAEVGAQVARVGRWATPLRLYAAAFADVASRTQDFGAVTSGARSPLSQQPVAAGLALVARGAIFDEPVRLRVDVPLYRSDAVGAGATGWRSAATRLDLTFSFTDLW